MGRHHGKYDMSQCDGIEEKTDDDAQVLGIEIEFFKEGVKEVDNDEL